MIKMLQAAELAVENASAGEIFGHCSTKAVG